MRQTGKKREMFAIIQLICATFPFPTHVSKTMLFMYVVFTKFLTIAVEEVQEKLEVYKVLGCEWECIFCNMYIGEGSHLGTATRFVEGMLGGEET